MKDWYEKNTEKEVRPFVKELRNKGFNTTCSCGHKMYIDLDLSLDGEQKRLYDMVWIMADKLKLDFKIYSFIEVTNGHLHDGATIKFKKRIKIKK